MAKTLKNNKNTYIIGVDEVGRGPLAGPVTVAALVMPKNLKIKTGILTLPPLRDSKKLSPRQREKWFEWIEQKNFSYAISDISPKIIEKINISQAANLAATRCVKKLMSKDKRLTSKNCEILLDGGLYLNLKFKNQNLNAQTIIRGDELVPAISLASIVAKIHRDKLMERLHKKYPAYSFGRHKGYGTKAHFKEIKKCGICKIHRKTFLK